MRSVFWKCRKDVLLDGSSPLTLVQETSGVGLDRKEGSEVTASGDGGGEERGASSHLQPLGDALHLQHLSSQHRLRAGGPRRDEERRPSLVRWLLCSHTHTHNSEADAHIR